MYPFPVPARFLARRAPSNPDDTDRTAARDGRPRADPRAGGAPRQVDAPGGLWYTAGQAVSACVQPGPCSPLGPLEPESMPLKLVCPNCRADVRLDEPLPLPGAAVQCERCATAIAVTYPPGVIEQLKARGKRFADGATPRGATPSSGGPSPRAPSHDDRANGVGKSSSSGSASRSVRPPSAPPPSQPRMSARGGGGMDGLHDLPIDPSTEVGRGRTPDTASAHRRDVGSSAPTEYDGATNGAGPSFEGIERTVGSMRTPYGGLPNDVDEAEGARDGGDDADSDDDSLDPPMTQAAPMVDNRSAKRPMKAPSAPPTPGPARGREPRSTPAPSAPSPLSSPRAKSQGGAPARAQGTPGPAPTSRGRAPASTPPPRPKSRSRSSDGGSPPRKSGGFKAVTAGVGCLGSMGMVGLGGAAIVALIAVAGAFGGYWYFSQDLPTVEFLGKYAPPTVTVVEDRNGQVLGEIFEEKRYVTPIDQIPDHVKHAFLAAEDANFYSHGGIDYMGIVRAVLRNTLSGRKAQGASTITQQVARNFLLTNEKTLVRKAKEVLLSWRIEEVYEKDHILYLYLNEIFLGAQSYGVEAASRTYFGKHVQDITIAEAAILAGLPQAPTSYSPYRGWDKARARQEYVIGQMLAKNFITQEQADAALAENVRIAPRENQFRSKAPYFTEHVRRYVVEKYGKERVLHEGLKVKTTCDLDLQTLGQTSVKEGVYDTDWRMGYRRNGVKNVGKDGIAKARAELEEKMRKAWAEDQDPAGRVAEPDKSVLVVGKRYEAVIVDVDKRWAKLGIGQHDAVLPIQWNDWLYEPDPSKSWRGRTATDLTAMVDSDDDGKRDAPILKAGDLVLVTVENLSTTDPKIASVFSGTPGGSTAMAAVKMFQIPEVESALLSMDVATGAVRTMVGGSDFDRSEFNRAIQARRQVGSTFKPIVYAAAVESKRVTTATVVADAPLAMATANEFVWKPSNYSNDYEGNMTMRQALAKSKNTCTVRILEAADPGMNDDVIYKFARKLGIGGPPTYALPADWVPGPKNDVLCPWVQETPRSTICMDRTPQKDPNLTDAQHRAKLGPDDKYMCRACDMSMGLGSASLTMEEMIRAYSAFATGGKLIEPYYVEEVSDRDGNILEKHEPVDPPQVMDPAVASIATWLMEGVVRGGTASMAGQQLGLVGLAGKTGTTNDEKDAWFVGFTNDVITAVWFGFDQPKTLGVSSTGGRTALPVWIAYMKAAAPKSKDKAFPVRGDVQFAMIEESTGRRVTSGGVTYPFLPGTVPEGTGQAAGTPTIDDLKNEL